MVNLRRNQKLSTQDGGDYRMCVRISQLLDTMAEPFNSNGQDHVYCDGEHIEDDFITVHAASRSQGGVDYTDASISGRIAAICTSSALR